MSIPDKFYRIARNKLGDLKDWFDHVDEEREQREQQEAERRLTRTEARRELDDSITSPVPSTPTAPRNDRSGIPIQPSLPQRTPDEILRGVRPAAGANTNNAGTSVSNTSSQSTAGRTTPPAASAPDPLAYHYRMLGLEPGADYGAVQAAYNKLAARCDPSRFAAGSNDERDARAIREKLEASYKALRDVLDVTARRFDLLEFDDAPDKKS